MSEYYTMKNYFIRLYDEVSREYAFNAKNIEQHENWKKELKQKLSCLIGLEKMKYCDMSPIEKESINMEGYRQDKVIIQTQPDVFMPFYILIPDKCNGIPVIALHGHSSDGKNGIAGITNKFTHNKIENYNYMYGLDLVKKGYIVFCPDLCGAGERREFFQQGQENVFFSSCNDINNAAISLGISLLGIIIHDLIRLVDYIQSYELCKKNTIACCGFSGGGLNALWLSAIDKRISFTVVSGYYHGLKDSILENNLCGCNFVPSLWKYIDICDLGAMIAPRLLIIESGINDNLNGKRGINNVFEQIEVTQRAYDLYKSKNLKHITFEGGHKWYNSAYNFIDEWSCLND